MGGLVVAVKPKDEAHNVIMLNNREENGEGTKKGPGFPGQLNLPLHSLQCFSRAHRRVLTL